MNLLARVMILNKQQLANSLACSDLLTEANQRLAYAHSLSRPEYLTLCRGVGACQVGAKHLMRVRQKVLKRYGHMMPAAHQSTLRNILADSEQSYLSGYELYQRLLRNIRALVSP